MNFKLTEQNMPECEYDTHIVKFDFNGDKYVWIKEPTGNRTGNDREMKHESEFIITKNGQEKYKERRFVSEYSDDKIEFSNSFGLARLIESEDINKIVHFVTY